MKRSNRLAWLGGLVLASMIVLTLIAAPTNSQINIGSTYNHAPDGYGAWYSFMQQRGANIQRWQKPFKDFSAEKQPVTLIQVNSSLKGFALDDEQQKWVEKGNNLVILGVHEPVSAANFTTMQQSSKGDVKIETRRRRELISGEKIDLSDRFGAIVWEKPYGKGKVILSSTPFLAANAYQDYTSNFEYLSDLVSKPHNLLFIDEYIHGYKDPHIKNSEAEGNLVSYLAKTPLLPMLVQIIILLSVLIWALNRRFGKPVSLVTPVIDNSQAYIQALAGVLQKAESRNFVIQMVGKQEQLQLQQALGLGQELLDRQTLVNAWLNRIGDGSAELDAALQPQTQKSRRISEKDLIRWLEKWQTLRRHL